MQKVKTVWSKSNLSFPYITDRYKKVIIFVWSGSTRVVLCAVLSGTYFVLRMQQYFGIVISIAYTHRSPITGT
jgi:hypothetical protein